VGGDNPFPLGSQLPTWPKVDFASFGEVEVKPLSRIQQMAAGFLARNWVTIPHVTHHDEADVTELEALRRDMISRREDVKITMLACIIKAAVAALEKFPTFNSSLDASIKQLVLKKYFHIGVAVDTPTGLLVPVVRDCNKKSVVQLGQEVAELSAKARAKGLAMSEMSGGCFSISSLGAIGGTAFTPIINAPEVAILGAARTAWKPRRAQDGGVEWRLMLPLSLSYDHRVLNGADAARFTRFLSEILAQPRHFGSLDVLPLS